MKLNLKLILGLLTSTILVFCGLNGKNIQKVQAQQEDISFVCAFSYDKQNNKKIPTTFIWTPDKKIPLIVWETDFFAGSGYDPKTRCEAVSPRFQKAYYNGTINLMTNGTINNQPVICTAQTRNGGANTANGKCHTLLITMRPQDDTLAFIKHLEDVFDGRQSGPMRHNSGNGQRQVFIEIDIDRFIRNARGE